MSAATCRDGIPGYRARRTSGLRTPLIHILEPDDVVLAEITSGLDLDEFKRDLAWVGEAVNRADRDIGRLILVNDFLDLADRHFRRPAHHHPVLGAVEMPLQRQHPTGGHDDALDLKPFAGIDGFIMTPRTVNAAMIGRLRSRGLLERGD